MSDFDHTGAFAQTLVDLRAADLSQADLDRLAALILDYCGVALGGTTRPWITALHAYARRQHGHGRALVIGSTIHTSAETAAFVNGAAGHSFELDDTHDASMSHPGAVVIPTAFAVGAERGATGADVLAAIAAGYEAMARIGIAARAERVIAAGFHPTAVFGVFGAAVTAGKLMGFGAADIAQAWGHALSLAAGSMQFSQESTGAEVKRLHAGYAARNGILAAQMSEAGISAPARSLDGRYGFLALYGHDPQPQQLLARGARGLAIHDVSVKPYACCRLLHSMIDGLRTATDSFTLGADRIQSILVRGPGKLAEQHMVRRPQTPMAAQYSLPFTVGATLAFGPERFDAFEPRHLGDPAILAWADRVEVAADASLEASYPAHFGTEVELRLADGETRIVRVLDSVGTAAAPMTPAQVQAKGRGLARDRLDSAAFDRLIGAVDALPHAASVDTLQQACAA